MPHGPETVYVPAWAVAAAPRTHASVQALRRRRRVTGSLLARWPSQKNSDPPGAAGGGAGTAGWLGAKSGSNSLEPSLAALAGAGEAGVRSWSRGPVPPCPAAPGLRRG